VHLFLLHFCCTHTYSCYAHVAHLFLLHLCCTRICPWCASIAHLFLLHYSLALDPLGLLLNFWPPCVVVMCSSLVHDLLHCCVVLLFNF
jgi:hypothetical protein